MMARLKASVVQDLSMFRESELPPEGTRPQDGTALLDRSIGNILSESKNLSAAQIEEIVALQREAGLRFGEAAIKLGYATADDVLFALSKQFHYPYAPEESRTISPELVALNQPHSHQAEAFRAIRTQLLMRLGGDEGAHYALAVVSPDSGDGKTFFAANLAVSLAQLGDRTLLVDCDLRGPRQHEVFGIDNTTGLSAILSGRAEERAIQQSPSIPSLFVLPVGVTPPNPLELVERPAFRLLMTELRSKFDHVIVDTPAAIYGSDSSVIAARCGAALVVARKHASRIAALQDLVASVAQSSAKLAGVIMNEY